jgi:hypothetical protein
MSISVHSAAQNSRILLDSHLTEPSIDKVLTDRSTISIAFSDLGEFAFC